MFPFRRTSLAGSQRPAEGKLKMSNTLHLPRLQSKLVANKVTLSSAFNQLSLKVWGFACNISVANCYCLFRWWWWGVFTWILVGFGAACGDNKRGRRDNVSLCKWGTKAAAVLISFLEKLWVTCDLLGKWSSFIANACATYSPTHHCSPLGILEIMKAPSNFFLH